MKVMVMTDMEGVAGMINHDDWVVPGARYYEEGKKLLTLETNAAIEGLAAGGFTEFLVVDGHGYGGVNHLLLDPRAQFARGPYDGNLYTLLNPSFDAIVWVGQHAKAGTPYAQMAHTGWFNVIDCTINGVSVGEFGQVALCAASYGVRSIFGAGDEAFAKEAAELVPGIETVSVKRGLVPGSGDEFNTEGYKERNNGAIHLHPEVARAHIREGAEKAARRFADNREPFTLLKTEAPFRREIRYRSDGTTAAYTRRDEYDNIISLLGGKPYKNQE
ncbi:M55 family metallopeptidase [Paenibacillus hodogayensis]|uniref:M55 family metallopeptidase n=1 Tax=Paenibacillus hodogayensis TaxID=279208 RepID=A0ABV5W4R0_9BACL